MLKSYNILILGGTSDANILSKKLKKLKEKNNLNINLFITTNTNYGKKLAEKFCDKVISREECNNSLEEIIINKNINLIVDATHPYAINVSKKVIGLSKKLQIQYIRYERPVEQYGNVMYVNTFKEAGEEALRILEEQNNNNNNNNNNKLMYLAGIKNLNVIVNIVGKENVVCRILPISVNEALKILPSKNIIGMEGVFSTKFNKQLYEEYNCSVIITKDSGASGGMKEKIEGAINCGIVPIVIKRPQIKYPLKFESVTKIIEYILGNLNK